MMCLMSANAANSFGMTNARSGGGGGGGDDARATDPTTTKSSDAVIRSFYETPPVSNQTSPSHGSDPPPPPHELASSASSNRAENDVGVEKTSECGDQPSSSSESPCRGWRRILVNVFSEANGNKKPVKEVHFVSPQGKRFTSHEEVLKYLQENKLESSQRFLLNESDAKTNLKLLVNVSFCNMRQNILDLKKKRGRKRSRDSRRGSTDSTYSSSSSSVKVLSDPENDRSIYTPMELIIEEDRPLKHLKKTPFDELFSESHSEPALLKFPQDVIKSEVQDTVHVDRDSFMAKRAAERESSDSLDLRLSSSEDEENSKNINGIHSDQKQFEGEIVVSTYSKLDSPDYTDELTAKIQGNIPDTACSVTAVDIFKDTPLDSFICDGCSEPYNSKNSFTVNFNDGVIYIVCSHCLWWTYRKISTKDCSYQV